MNQKNVSPGEIFRLFLKMGSFAFGGVYSMLSFFEKELVEKKKWLSHDEFTENVAMGQITPGAPIVNTGIFIGYRLAGLKGGIMTILGQTIPSFLIIITLASAYLKYNNTPILQSALKGVGAGVVALVFSVVVNMGKKIEKSNWSIALFLAATTGVFIFHLNPILIIIISGICGILFLRK